MKFIPAILLATFIGATAQAQTLKIATVDLGKVFTNYYKTKLAQGDLDNRKNQIFKDENSMLEDLKKGDTDYKALLASASDQALSQDERDKKKQAADAKLKQLQDSKAALDSYDRSAKQNLADQFQRMRDKLLIEIREIVNAKAKAGGYNLVIDSAAETVNATPVVIYNNSQADLTDDVIKQLNTGAPIDLNSPAFAPMSAPSLLSTNRP
ncbi:MAG TPA: OmpH family outer membrane protein [Candidatus Baltobacteraceae bacterium]|nr:OmpH family outer membrane protein [Candidatus Baltobacteraceae bacterium]